MPATEKRVKHEEPQSHDVITIISDVNPNLKLVYLDEYTLRKCLDGHSDESVEALPRILQSLCDLLTYRCNNSMRRSIMLEFFRSMAIHGVPFRYVIESRASKFLAREEYNEKYPPTMNMIEFFRDLSSLEYGLRENIWVFHSIQMGSSTPYSTSSLVQRSSSLQALRHQLCMATWKLNYRAVVAQLANSEILRMTSETIERSEKGWRELTYQVQKLIYFDSPITFFMALQCVLTVTHDASFNLGGRLVMLATMQSMIYTTTAARNTILMQLCEVLIAVMLCGDLAEMSAIMGLEHGVHRYNKGYDNVVVWNAYKLMTEYYEWRGRSGFGGMILSTAKSLFEVAESMPAHGILFLETACRIWASSGRCEDKIAEAVSRVLQKCPQLLDRIVELLKAIGLDHEVEIVIEEVCEEGSTLHPSDKAWVGWCQPRIERPERYGNRTNVLTRCVDVLFRFLDHGSNRGNGRALQRYDWWPRFHTVPLPAEAESRRAELLAALTEIRVDWPSSR